MPKNAIVTIFHDTRRSKKEGTYPVKLRIYFDAERQYYPLGYDLTKDEFERSYLAAKPREDRLKNIKVALRGIESKANGVIDKLDLFTFRAFESKMFKADGDIQNVFYFYDKYIDELESQHQIGTASNYRLSKKAIAKFLTETKGKQKSEPKLYFKDITAQFLQQFENWMQEQGRSLTTVSIYLRALRTIFNYAIAENEISKEIYPFGKRKYVVPAGQNVKKALSKEQLKALYEYKVEENPYAEKARDFWFFSYQCNGINIRDIADLKYKDIEGENLIFNRHKTKRTSKGNSKSIVASRTKYLNTIIEKYGNPINNEAYVFPILQDGMSEADKRRATQNFTKFINQHIKKLAVKAGLSGDISTYWARHSFTTNAIRNGASMEYIQDSLGHQSMNTTMNYWSGFEENVKKDIAEKLMDF